MTQFRLEQVRIRHHLLFTIINKNNSPLLCPRISALWKSILFINLNVEHDYKGLCQDNWMNRNSSVFWRVFAAHTYLIDLMEYSASCHVWKMTLQSFSSEQAVCAVSFKPLHVALNEDLRRHLFIFNLENRISAKIHSRNLCSPYWGLLLNTDLPESLSLLLGVI